jgi:hypothetical protein
VIISNTVLEMGIRKPQRKKLFTVWQDMKQKPSKSNCSLHWKYI